MFLSYQPVIQMFITFGSFIILENLVQIVPPFYRTINFNPCTENLKIPRTGFHCITWSKKNLRSVASPRHVIKIFLLLQQNIFTQKTKYFHFHNDEVSADWKKHNTWLYFSKRMSQVRIKTLDQVQNREAGKLLYFRHDVFNTGRQFAFQESMQVNSWSK